jgi:hypothetical protein
LKGLPGLITKDIIKKEILPALIEVEGIARQ